mgnify:CR=1 FL=1
MTTGVYVRIKPNGFVGHNWGKRIVAPCCVLVLCVIILATFLGSIAFFQYQSLHKPSYQSQSLPIGGNPCVTIPRQFVGNNTNPLWVLRNGTSFIYMACGQLLYYDNPTVIWNNSLGISRVVCYHHYCYLQTKNTSFPYFGLWSGIEWGLVTAGIGALSK